MWARSDPNHMRTESNESSGYLPRPALGRRPWLAFLRRARIRRRFAFAMGQERTSTVSLRQNDLAVTGSDGWLSRPLAIGFSRRDRRIGLRPAPGPFDLLMQTRSIHTFGMASSLRWVALDGSGHVVGVGTLSPRRLIVVRRARFILEQPAVRTLPERGAATVLGRRSIRRDRLPG